MPVQAVVVVSVAVVLAGIAAVRIARVWMKYRGRAVVKCPENQKPAGVEVNAVRAAFAMGGTGLKLSCCSRWPERAGCGQECLSQIEAKPEDCLVKYLLARWYEGKSCVSCGRPIENIDWVQAKPALRWTDKISKDWSQIPAEQLQETLAAAEPICFACHMASTLMREHPEMVVDRNRHVPT